jgi:hypothetical protein
MIVVRKPFRQTLDRTFAHTVHGTAAGRKLGGRRSAKRVQGIHPQWLPARPYSTPTGTSASRRPTRGRAGHNHRMHRNEDRCGHDKRHSCACKDVKKAPVNDTTAWVTANMSLDWKKACLVCT